MSGKGKPRPNYGSGISRSLREGYIRVRAPGHPLAGRDGYVYEHRKVAWDAGLLTDPADHVHHRNHDRADNSIENLVVLTNGDHQREHNQPGRPIRNQYGVSTVATPQERIERNRRRCREYQQRARSHR